VKLFVRKNALRQKFWIDFFLGMLEVCFFSNMCYVLGYGVESLLENLQSNFQCPLKVCRKTFNTTLQVSTKTFSDSLKVCIQTFHLSFLFLYTKRKTLQVWFETFNHGLKVSM